MKPGIMILFYLLYGAVNYYVGIRTQAVFIWLSSPASIISLWLIMIAGTAAFPLSRITHLPEKITTVCLWVGSYWFGILYYAFIFTFSCDLLAIVNKYLLHFAPLLPHQLNILGTLLLTLLIVLLIYGTYNARQPRIRRYELTVSKAAGFLEQLHIVAVSDLHLGKIVNASRLEQLVLMIEQLAPDLVLLPGDIIDRDAAEYARQKMPDLFRRLAPPYGLYGVLGNHEYISGEDRKMFDALTASGIHILQDQAQEINHAFILAGRDDKSRNIYKDSHRQPVSAILQQSDHRLPIILMDHQPSALDEAQAAGVDVLLAGHTHRGQIFPNNWITAHAFEVDWGYLRKGALQIIVSCGYGTWGPPLRIGNHPEIVDLIIRFQPSAAPLIPDK